MQLNDVNSGIVKNRRKKRLGRGTGSGLGKTSGRGHKGQRSRAGHSQSVLFQGGAMPMFRRIPKRGFNNKFALKVGTVNVGDLEKAFAAGDEVNAETLREHLLVNYRYDLLKILGDGELTKKLSVTAHAISNSAREKIEKAGGSVTLLPGKTPVVKNKQSSAEKK